jgi:hypothetical protein
VIFRPELAALVVKGEKTATRRRVVFYNERAMWRIEKPWRYPVGKVFAVQPGRGVDGIAQAVVTGRWIEPLCAITPAGARAEGFPTRDAFVDAFRAINGYWDPDARVHVVEFKLTGPACWDCGGDGHEKAHQRAIGICGFCFGTGIAVTPEARELIAELERESRGG